MSNWRGFKPLTDLLDEVEHPLAWALALIGAAALALAVLHWVFGLSNDAALWVVLVAYGVISFPWIVRRTTRSVLGTEEDDEEV